MEGFWDSKGVKLSIAMEVFCDVPSFGWVVVG